ncbi:tRNA dihydrouridine synthase [Desulfomarina sp.]
MNTIQNSRQPFIYLAPIRGITDVLFRNTFFRHFGGIDAVIAPFINPQKNCLFDDKMLKDLLPETNDILPIPQLLHTDPGDFLSLAERLADLGYSHVNWNLGCPAPMVTRKKRGSGLLPYPERILFLLEKVSSRIQMKLSIKTRFGYEQKEELFHLLPRFNDFPLKEIIIHTRLGKQLYRGKTDPRSFATCLKLSRHPLIYNGDIVTEDDFAGLAHRFPDTSAWMIGRGLLMNPFLAEEIKGLLPGDGEAKRNRLVAFHEELYRGYREQLSGPGHLLGRMKQLWLYLITSFPGKKKAFKKLKKSSTVYAFEESVKQIFDL